MNLEKYRVDMNQVSWIREFTPCFYAGSQFIIVIESNSGGGHLRISCEKNNSISWEIIENESFFEKNIPQILAQLKGVVRF